MEKFKLKNHVLSIFIIGIFLLLAFGSEDDDKKGISTGSLSSKKVVPNLNEDEYVKYFQGKWDSVKLSKEDGFPQYETYENNLENIIQEMLSVLNKDSSYKFNSPLKLNKLRIRFIDSKKMKDASMNWLIYGQPELGESDLKYACETFIKENANDPSSIDIEGFKIRGQSKKGWIGIMKYRGKNAFGGIVLNVSTFDIRFNAQNKVYYVVSAY